MTVMIANPSGIFAVYSMREVFEFDRFWAIGSGATSRWARCTRSTRRRRAPRPSREPGVLAGAEFDTGTSVPITLHEVRLK